MAEFELGLVAVELVALVLVLVAELVGLGVVALLLVESLVGGGA